VRQVGNFAANFHALSLRFHNGAATAVSVPTAFKYYINVNMTTDFLLNKPLDHKRWPRLPSARLDGLYIQRVISFNTFS
jgi:hypothetical protein